MAENKKQDRRRKKQNIQSDIVDNEKKNLRNKETNIIAFFFVGLFLATIVYLCIFNVKDAGTIVNNPYNKRVDNQESKVVRGDILADDGDVLATTLRMRMVMKHVIILMIICSVIRLDLLLLQG